MARCGRCSVFDGGRCRSWDCEVLLAVGSSVSGVDRAFGRIWMQGTTAVVISAQAMEATGGRHG